MTATAAFDPWMPGASVLREKVFEHIFLGELMRALLRQGQSCEVLRSEFDGSGYDLVLESGPVTRHVQLKAMRTDGRRAHVDVNIGLATKPAGCVVWMLIDPESFSTDCYLWFGGVPGDPLPPLGSRPARHSKADAAGRKGERPNLRRLTRGSFTAVRSVDELIDRLFGDELQRDLIRLRRHLAGQPELPISAPVWQRMVRSGFFDALPERLDEEEMVGFTHLVDGYALGGMDAAEGLPVALTAQRPDPLDPTILPSDLWAAMLIEHRRQRFGDQEFAAEAQAWFDACYRRLRSLLSPRHDSQSRNRLDD